MNKLRELRRSRNITLRELSEKIGISPISLCRIEKGERKMTTEFVSAVAEALDLNFSEIEELMTTEK